MKFVSTILCTALLVISQLASLAVSPTHSNLPCACCFCTQISCCATAPAPVPIAPRVAYQNDSQSYAAPPATVVFLLPLPIPTPLSESLSSAPGFSSQRPAIYDRNCSYLL